MTEINDGMGDNLGKVIRLSDYSVGLNNDQNI